jgi:rod shape-determining protein MreB
MGTLDIGIDLGTTKIIIYHSERGELLHQPAVVAVNIRDNKIIAIGDEALRMLGRTPGYIRAVFPMADGVISDHTMTEELIRGCIHQACKSFLVKHRVIICVPSVVTDVERRTVIETVVRAGGRKVYLIDEPIAAAIGAGVDIMRPNGTMVVDIGGGTMDAAVISMAGIVVSQSRKYAGDKVDEEIIRLMAQKYKLSIGKKMAEQIKREIGTVYRPSVEKTAHVRGRSLLTGYPQELSLSQQDIFEAMQPFTEMLVSMVKGTLEATPPELIGDLMEKGIILTGGGSMLAGIPALLEQETGVHTALAENPVECVSIGTGKAFEYIGQSQTGFSSEAIYNS